MAPSLSISFNPHLKRWGCRVARVLPSDPSSSPNLSPGCCSSTRTAPQGAQRASRVGRKRVRLLDLNGAVSVLKRTVSCLSVISWGRPLKFASSSRNKSAIPADLGIPFPEVGVPFGAESRVQLVSCPAERVASLKRETPLSELKASAAEVSSSA